MQHTLREPLLPSSSNASHSDSDIDIAIPMTTHRQYDDSYHYSTHYHAKNPYKVHSIIAVILITATAIFASYYLYLTHYSSAFSQVIIKHHDYPPSEVVQHWSDHTIPSIETTIGIDRSDDGWKNRYHNIIHDIESYGSKSELLFLGDSITDFFQTGCGKELWEKYYLEPYNAINLGISGDRTQHLIWRLENDHLNISVTKKLLNPQKIKACVIMIGTNNCANNYAEDTSNGIAKVIQLVNHFLPNTKILLLSVFPRQSWRLFRINEEVNNYTLGFSDSLNQINMRDPWDIVTYIDFRQPWLRENVTDVMNEMNITHSDDQSVPLRNDLFDDGLHPNAEGYQVWADALQPYLDEVFG